MKIKIDDRGRITIPEAIRETLGFNNVANLVVKNNKLIITKEYNPIHMIDEMLSNIKECELEYIDILYKAKKEMKELEGKK